MKTALSCVLVGFGIFGLLLDVEHSEWFVLSGFILYII